jgi:hypothetical protein
LVNLLPAFHPKAVFISVNKMGLLYTTDCQCFFSIQFAKQCLLMGELSLLTFSTNIDRYVVIPTFQLFLFFKGLILCSQITAAL